MNKLSRTSLLVAISGSVFVSAALAQAPVPGEKWRQTMSMKMAGMSMPARTQEVCVPVGRANDAVSQANDNGRCEMTERTQSARGFTANMACGGKEPTVGSIEVLTLGPDKNRSTMKMRPKGSPAGGAEEMVMITEGQKLPGSCDAAEMERKMNSMITQAKAQGDAEMRKVCADFAAKVRKDPATIADGLYAIIPTIAGVPAQCTGAAEKQAVCAAAETRPGFSRLNQMTAESRAAVSQRTSGPQPKALGLTDAMKFCGLAVEPLQSRLVDEAEKENAWPFFMRYAPKARSDVIGKRECTGRAFTEARSPRFASFCQSWGLRATGKVSLDEETGPSATRSAGSSASAGAPSGTAAQESTAIPAETPPEQPASTKDKATDALKKGGKVLRGIFGGGN